jgi:hypothetical protein
MEIIFFPENVLAMNLALGFLDTTRIDYIPTRSEKVHILSI